jgi:hypothetical protein
MINIQEVSHNRSTVSSNGDSPAAAHHAAGQVQRGRGHGTSPWRTRADQDRLPPVGRVLGAG